jgi:hypothetical protein
MISPAARAAFIATSARSVIIHVDSQFTKPWENKQKTNSPLDITALCATMLVDHDERLSKGFRPAVMPLFFIAFSIFQFSAQITDKHDILHKAPQQ